jgi:cysteine desulfurase
MVVFMIYMDDAASTRVNEKVVKVMEKYYLEEFGNASSYHDMGENARNAIENVRKQIGLELECKASSIIFTSGSTESNNLAFLGLKANRHKIIVSSIEHSSIFALCNFLKKEGFEIVEVPVDIDGKVNMKFLSKEVDSDTLLVSIMHVNNEIGVIQDISKIGKLCRSKGAFYHCDAAQSFGKLKINVNSSCVDLLTGSAHKIGGPKGIGFLFIGERVSLVPLIHGGGQEGGLRGGTENVPGIVGFGKALELIKGEDISGIKDLRDYFINGLKKLGGKINGSIVDRIHNNINVTFPGMEGEDLVIKLSLKGIMCSTGSACENFKERDSRVLKAIGLTESEIEGSLRFSLSKDVSKKDVDFVLDELKVLTK